MTKRTLKYLRREKIQKMRQEYGLKIAKSVYQQHFNQTGFMPDAIRKKHIAPVSFDSYKMLLES